MSTCIYCGSTGPFSDEHSIPACLGEFRGFPLLTDRICKTCNNEIGKLEEQFCRSGPEGFFRRLLGIGGRKSHTKANPFHRGSGGGKPIDFEADHPVYGFPILWELNPGDRTVRQNRQIVVIGDEGGSKIIRIHERMKTPDDLKTVLREKGIERIATAYAFADEQEIPWIESLLHGLAEMSEWTLDDVTKINKPVATIAVTNAYFRAIAKCAFHYFLATFSKATGAEPQFEPIRNFILNGGDPQQFVRHGDIPIIGYPAPNLRPSAYGHLVAANWESGQVWGRCQFFIGPDHEPPASLIKISDAPNGIPELFHKGGTGHHFVYFPDGRHGRFDGETSQLIQAREHRIYIRQVRRCPCP
jgi:hypothetical protein